jgi:ABC-2 type transport system permease protein
MDPGAVFTVWQRDLIRYFREKSQFYSSISRPILWLFVLGMGLRGSSAGVQGVNYTQFMFPGILAMTTIFTSIQSAISIIWDREFGFLKAMLVTPVPRSSIAVGKAFSGMTLSLIQGGIVLLLAPVIKVMPPWYNVPLLILVMALLSYALTNVGIVIAARMTSFQGFGTIMNFIIMPMWFLSGALFPARGIPAWLAVLVRLNPLTYGVDLIRRLALGFGYYPVLFDVGFVVVFAVVATAAAVLSFNRGEF